MSSWITGLADKAENILNKIDQNAASLLPTDVSSGNGSGAVGGARTPPLAAAVVESSALSAMRKSLSGSTQSLKATFSPTKSSRNQRNGDGSASVKSEDDICNKSESIAIDIGAADSEREFMAMSMPAAAQETLMNTSTVSNASASADSQELAAFKIALSEVSNERDELRLRLAALNRDIENAGLQQRAQELELLLQRVTEERDHAQEELRAAQTASSAYVHSISELEANLAKLQQQYLEVAQKLQMQLKETEQQRLELKEYRTKAQRALQVKDNLIAELKSSGGIGDGSATELANGGAAAANIEQARLLQLEYDGLKQEQQQTLEENRALQEQLDELRHDWSAYSKQQLEDMAALRGNEDALRKELRAERVKTLGVESEQRMLVQELDALRQQLSNQMAAAATRLQEKEKQLQQLRGERMSRSAAAANNATMAASDDYDVARIKALTQTLVDKQHAIENVTAERNALRIQLEKAQDQMQQLVYSKSNSSSGGSSKLPRNALLLNTTDDVKAAAHYPLLLRENPFDNRVARRVKRAYTSLDSAGIRLGAFLRRYPLMRIFVLMYVALLHLWVMFVLLSSTPN